MAQEKSFYVYTHSRPDGSVFYVGKGSGRRAWHFTKGRNPHHKAIIKKYGVDNIVVTLYPCESEQVAFDLEKKMIAEREGLANKTDGGEGSSGRPITDKVRAAFDAARRGPKSEKFRAAAAENLRRAWKENPAMRENALRMAEKRRGVKRPKHVIDALIAAHKGKKQSGVRLEQTRAALVMAQEKAKAWHSTEEGKRWHSENGKNAWVNREWVEVTCEECGRKFGTPYPARARYCQQNCRATARRRREGRPVGVRPKRVAPQMLSGKRLVG